MERYLVLLALLLNPAFTFGGLARVEEVSLTPEEVARVASLNQKEASSLKEGVAVVAGAETAILVKGEQGRPCILKPNLEGGWKKLCAVFWKPGGKFIVCTEHFIHFTTDKETLLRNVCTLNKRFWSQENQSWRRQ